MGGDGDESIARCVGIALEIPNDAEKRLRTGEYFEIFRVLTFGGSRSR